MLAAAVGSTPEVVRTRPMAPRDRQSKIMGVLTGQNQNFHQRRSQIEPCAIMADGSRWPHPAGKPWHEFVPCKCHVGTRMLSCVQTPVAKTSEWLRCLVGSIVGWTWTSRETSRRPAQVVVRDRKVVRECALCIGMSAAVMAVAAMVDTRTDSSRTDRSHHLHGCLSA